VRRRFDPWQDIFKIFTISMYKCYFEKLNIDFQKKHLSANSRISILHIQISNVHMGVAAGPASQDAVLKLKYASPGLQCCILPRLSSTRFPAPAGLPFLFWPFCPFHLFLEIRFRLFCPVVMSTCPVPAVLSWLLCPSVPVLRFM
jgi:hypothetical protein